MFRGDDIRNADNTLAMLQEAKVNPTGLAGINLNLVYGVLHGHKPHTVMWPVPILSPCSRLGTNVCRTAKGVDSSGVLPLGAAMRTVRLVRALYGHPESGWRWDEVQRNFELYERRSLR